MSRASRFVWVGIGGFLVQGAVLQGATGAGVPYLLATALAVEAAILHNFLWHERWTWADRRVERGRLRRFARFNGATALVSIGGNVAVMYGLAGRLHLPLLLAAALAVLLLSLVNFLAADRLVFRSRADESAGDRCPLQI